MPAKLTQLAVESILRRQGLKVLEWPSGGYVNSSEKVLLSCDHGHSYWEKLRNPLDKKKGCSRCRGGWSRTPSEWESAAREKGFEIVAWGSGKKGVKSRVTAVCSDGHISETTVDNIVNGNGGCLSCGRADAAKTRITPKNEVVSRLQSKGLSLISFLGRYRGLSTHASVKCDKRGHEFSDSVAAMLGRPFGCSRCSPVARKSERERIEQIESAGNVFVGWLDDTKAVSANSVAKVMCYGGHLRTATVDRLVHGKTQCPACISFGYDPEKTGFLYAMLAEDGLTVKIGITNNLPRRERELVRETPFPFKRIGVIRGPGRYILNLEKVAHEKFPSANFSGFKGATEWLEWGHDLHKWLADNA